MSNQYDGSCKTWSKFLVQGDFASLVAFSRLLWSLTRSVTAFR